VLVAAWGLYQAALGAYFIFLRPPLLPEDLRFVAFTRVSAAELDRLTGWLRLVFTVMGGQMAGVGVLAVLLASRLGRSPANRADLVGLAAAGAVSVGLMSAVNFLLASDFRFALLLPVVLWALALATLVWDRRSPSPRWAAKGSRASSPTPAPATRGRFR
jgi:hypothetical protein